MYVILYNPKADNNKGRDNALMLKEKSGEELRFEDITQIKDIRSYLKTIPSGEKNYYCRRRRHTLPLRQRYGRRGTGA